MKSLKIRLSKTWFIKHKNLILLLFPPLVLLTIVIYLSLFYKDRALPNIFVSSIKVSGLTKSQIYNLLSEKTNNVHNINLIIDGQNYNLELEDMGFSYDLDQTVNAAYFMKRNLRDFYHFNKKSQITPYYVIDQQRLDFALSEIGSEIKDQPVYPKLFIDSGIIAVSEGKPGKTLDKIKLVDLIKDNLSQFDQSPIIYQTGFVNPKLNDIEKNTFIKRGQKLLGKTLILKDAQKIFSFSDVDLVELLDFKYLYSQQGLNKISESIKTELDKEPQEPTLIVEGNKAVEFSPSSDGVRIITDDLDNKIRLALTAFENTDQETIEVEISKELTSPKIKTGEINNFGIEEKIGIGKSKFVGSISSRIHNISLASSRFNGIIISPGEVFSFNKTLGDVSKFTGYQQAYIIKGGQTVLGDGGGVCQVSTTLFRAVLNAGLPIIERHAHSYRVSYYEQGTSLGIDATVYDPTADLKFKNDTPNYLLIQTKMDSNAKTLDFEIYGTNDGRVATITKPVITSQTPPPEDLYIDDPTLPAGQIKQIDYKAWGAKVNFNYKVEREGKEIYEKTFYSNYQPWQAKFLRGTGNS